MHIYQKCWKTDPNLRPGVNEVHEILTQLKIKQFKLNHGLIITDHNNIKTSIQAITVEHGELNRSLYKGQPFVCTGINSSNDICINFPVVEINYNSALSEFLGNKDNENISREIYGDFLARKFLFGL